MNNRLCNKTIVKTPIGQGVIKDWYNHDGRVKTGGWESIPRGLYYIVEFNDQDDAWINSKHVEEVECSE